MAVVAPECASRGVLVALADAGVVDVERLDRFGVGPAGEALSRRPGGSTEPLEARLGAEPVDPSTLEAQGRWEELAGEAQLESVEASLRHRGAVVALLGWSPVAALGALGDRLAALGGAVVRLESPRGVQPPTVVDSRGPAAAFQPLVNTYTVVPYADLNPSGLVGLAYVVMFGMMFGDVGRGLLVIGAGLALRQGWPAPVARYRRFAPFIMGCGLSSTLFGLAFGEFFGPTHVLPTLWLAPLSHATTLLAVAIALGALLLALSYILGSINRWREGGPATSFVATSGVAGGLLYLGLAVVAFSWYRRSVALAVLGGAMVVVGAVLGFVGAYALTGGRGAGAAEASMEVFDAVLRIGTNTISFARLAAFGLIDVALGSVVWSATDGLAHHGAGFVVLAAVVFVVGNAVTFALEGLVAGVQALRLEYYEMFSRIFVSEGREFRPWHVPTLPAEET